MLEESEAAPGYGSHDAIGGRGLDRGDRRRRAADRRARPLRRARQFRRVLAAGRARSRRYGRPRSHDVTPRADRRDDRRARGAAREGSRQRRRLDDARAHLLRAQPPSRGRARVRARRRARARQTRDLLADYADALGAAQGGTLQGKPLELVERALNVDPTQWKALALAGTAAFNRKDYAQAVAYWERMKATVPAGLADRADRSSEHRGSARAGRPQGRCRRRRRRLRWLRPRPAPQRRVRPEATAVAGTVKLAPALAAKASPDDTVFIFARAAQGPRMPLAILRKQVTRSAASRSRSTIRWRWHRTWRCRISARSSSARASRKSGQAMPQSGDLEGLLARRSRSAADSIAVVIEPRASVAHVSPSEAMQTDVDVLVRRRRNLRSRDGFHAAGKRGATVEVLEAAPRAGGVIGTRHRNGALVEHGPNSTLDTSPLINELLDALGIRGERIDASAVAATRYIVRDGKLVALPTSPGAFLATSARSRSARSCGCARAVHHARARRRRGDRSPNSSGGGSVPSFSTTRSTRSSPACMRAIPERISVSAAFPRLHALEQKYGSLIKGQIMGARERRAQGEVAKNVAASFSFRDGMQTLTDALAARDRPHRDRRERAAHRARHGRRVDRRRRARRRTRCCGARRAVVLAVPAYEAAKLVRELWPPATRGLERDSLRADRERRDRVPPRRHPASARRVRLSRAEEGIAADPRLAVLEQHVRGPRAARHRAADDVRRRHAQSRAAVRNPMATLGTLVARGARRARRRHGSAAMDRHHALDRTRFRSTTSAMPSASQAARRRRARAAGLFFCASYRGGVSVGDCIKSAHASADAVTRFLVGVRPA